MNEINVVLLDIKEIAVILFAVFSVASGIVAFLSLAGIKFEWEQGNIKIIKVNKKMLIIPIGLFFAFAGMALYVNSLVEVPNVEGKIYSDAKNILIECGLDFNTIQNKEGDIVVVQFPKAESVVVGGSKIELMLLEEEITPAETKSESDTTQETSTLLTYIVKFDCQGGSSIPDKNVKSGDVLTDLPEPQKENYDFAGWLHDGKKITSITVEQDMVLVADWKEESSPPPTTPKICIVTFDARGGESIPAQKVNCGDSITNLPEPKKENYDFAGWLHDGKKITSITVEQDMVLVADWKEINPPPTTSKICIVTFDTRGGESISAQKVNYGDIITNLPIPRRDYHTFLGWKYNGEKVISICVTQDITVVADWEENESSGWVQSSAVPYGAEIVDTKWTYTQIETTESKESTLAGWIYNGSRTEVVGEGTFEYATFPSGFDTSSSICNGIYSSKDAVTVANGVEREYVSDNKAGYIYWHYSYPLSEANSANNRYVSNRYNMWIDGCGYTNIFCAFKSPKDYTVTTISEYGKEMIYRVQDAYTSYAESGGSWWWFRFEYYRCSYKDTRKIYQYYRTNEKESDTIVLPNDEISNVIKWVRYREK